MKKSPVPKLRKRLEELSTLNRILDVLNREADFDRALQKALEELVKLLGISTGWVFLSHVEPGDAKQGGLAFSARIGLPPALLAGESRCLREGSCDCQWLFRHGELDRGVNIVECSRLEAAQGDKGGLEVHASVPLLTKEGPVGILNLAAPGREPFDAETLEFLTAVGRTLGLAFRRARLQERQTREREALATLEERARLAREMHDSVAQLLFAADLSLRVARESELQREVSLERSAELVSSALSELRGLVELLRPADLSQGLTPALCRLADRVNSVVRVHFDSVELSLPDPVAETLYRVAQEGVHNALRHAHPKNIWIRLEGSQGGVRLRVEDDGRGVSELVRRGMGLLSLEQRTAAQGGSLRMIGRKPSGAVLEAKVPLRDESSTSPSPQRGGRGRGMGGDPTKDKT
ncbi:MAG: GAF domain-containing sensor histidine kinase [Thermaceae bacterium]|nr:GAF domain-containing sensor histidine kinase [Thermaceae bacterium]